MFSFNLPLQGTRRHAEERAADLSRRAASARRDAMETELAGALADSWTQHQLALRQSTLLQDGLLPLAEANFRSALTSYGLGRSELATVLDALRQQNNLQMDLLASQLEARLRALDIEALTGDES
jgi:outer membrane protein TolC